MQSSDLISKARAMSERERDGYLAKNAMGWEFRGFLGGPWAAYPPEAVYPAVTNETFRPSSDLNAMREVEAKISVGRTPLWVRYVGNLGRVCGAFGGTASDYEQWFQFAHASAADRSIAAVATLLQEEA